MVWNVNLDIFTPDFKDVVFNAKDNIVFYLERFLSNMEADMLDDTSNVKKSNNLDREVYMIFKYIKSPTLVGIGIYQFMKILTYYKSDVDNNTVLISVVVEMGKDIVRRYAYTLYVDTYLSEYAKNPVEPKLTLSQ